MGVPRLSEVHIDAPKAVPFPGRDGKLPGHRSEGVGFQVDFRHRLPFRIEDLDPDVLPLSQGAHPVVLVALEQDGLGLERVAWAVGAAVLEHAAVKPDRRIFDSRFLPVDVDGSTPPVPDPGFQHGRFPADQLLEIGRQQREALGVHGHLPFQDLFQPPPILEADRCGRNRLTSLIISHIDCKILSLPTGSQREGLLHVRGVAPISF